MWWQIICPDYQTPAVRPLYLWIWYILVVVPALSYLLEVRAVFASRCWAPATWSTRQSAWKKYLTFCTTHKLEPLPATELVLELYICYLCVTGLKYASIENYLSAVFTLHKMYGVPHINPRCFSLHMIKQGVKRTIGSISKQAPPLAIVNLHRIFAVLNLNNPSDLAFWATTVMGLRGLLRKSNLLEPGYAVRLCDIVRERWGIMVVVTRSKTIQYGERTLHVPFVYIPNSIFCVVSILNRLLGTVKYPSTVAHIISIGGDTQYRHYTYALYSRRLTAVVKTLGLPPYTSHSLRRGGASALMEAGFPVHDIRIWGDWRSLTVLLYMAKTEEARVNMDRKAVNLLFS